MSLVSSGRKNLLSSVAVFLVSAAVIGLELALMRCLSVTTWHHFAYLVISTALLGFGASGTLLTLVGSILDRRFGLWCTALTLAFALSVPLCIRAAQALPLDPQYVLYSGRQAFVAVVYHLLILVPFLLGAMVIGLSLMHFKGRVHGIYGANLLGSGFGGLLMLLLMFLLSEVTLLAVVAGLGLIAAGLWALYRRSRLAHSTAAIKKRTFVWPWLAIAGSAIVVVLLAAVWPIELRIDPYKSLAVFRRYESQSDAEHLITRHSPRGRLDVYASPLFHDTLFAGFTAVSAPPSQLRLLVDGNAAGTIFNITSAEEAEILDHTPMSVPYRLIERPKVLLLGEAHSRRNYMFHYSGAILGAVRWDKFKVHILPGGGSLPPMEVYNVVRDPGEKFGGMYHYLFAVTPLQNLIKSHKLLIQKFPHRVSKTMPEGAEITPHD